MWTKPRRTIQHIVDTNPEHMIVPLAALVGVSTALNAASDRSMGDTVEWPIIVVLAALVGPILGLAGLYIFAELLRWTGGWIGGQASSQHIRAALAWSQVPSICALPLWIPTLALVGEELFTSATPNIDADPALAGVVIGLAIVERTIGIWALVLLLKCVGQVQCFSRWKALGNTVLGGLIPIVMIIHGHLCFDFDVRVPTKYSDEFQAAKEAYERGDYDTALKELRPLADQGDATAQNSLGNMYFFGRGVPQDYDKAIRWYRLAA